MDRERASRFLPAGRVFLHVEEDGAEGLDYKRADVHPIDWGIRTCRQMDLGHFEIAAESDGRNRRQQVHGTRASSRIPVGVKQFLEKFNRHAEVRSQRIVNSLSV